MFRQGTFWKLLFIYFCVGLFSCNHSTDNASDQPKSGKPTFATHNVNLEVVPNVIQRDSLITVTMTCYPAMTGVGSTWITLWAVTALEFPIIDTIRALTNVLVRASFVSGVPYKQQWKFRPIARLSAGTSPIEVRATFDSVYVADSLRTYYVYSEELKKIFGVIDNSDAGGVVYINTNP